MAPEQVRGEVVDGRADIFALGAVLYEMLAGRRAFKGDSTLGTLDAVLTLQPPDLSDVSRDVPPALSHIVRRCLAKSPDDRFATAADSCPPSTRSSGRGTCRRPPACWRSSAGRW